MKTKQVYIADLNAEVSRPNEGLKIIEKEIHDILLKITPHMNLDRKFIKIKLDDSSSIIIKMLNPHNCRSEFIAYLSLEYEEIKDKGDGNVDLGINMGYLFSIVLSYGGGRDISPLIEATIALLTSALESDNKYGYVQVINNIEDDSNSIIFESCLEYEIDKNTSDEDIDNYISAQILSMQNVANFNDKLDCFLFRANAFIAGTEAEYKIKVQTNNIFDEMRYSVTVIHPDGIKGKEYAMDEDEAYDYLYDTLQNILEIRKACLLDGEKIVLTFFIMRREFV